MDVNSIWERPCPRNSIAPARTKRDTAQRKRAQRREIGDRHHFGAEFLPAKTELRILPSTQRTRENMPVPFFSPKVAVVPLEGQPTGVPAGLTHSPEAAVDRGTYPPGDGAFFGWPGLLCCPGARSAQEADIQYPAPCGGLFSLYLSPTPHAEFLPAKAELRILPSKQSKRENIPVPFFGPINAVTAATRLPIAQLLGCGLE
jgi:hypothetical protein